MLNAIYGYKDYMVSDAGYVVSLKNDKVKILKPREDKKRGYLYVGLCKNNKTKIFSLHRLVATAFIQNPSNKAEVNHINGNKKDNRVSNLEWVTREENIRHAIKIGIMPKPPSNKGKFGKEHNKSLGYVLIAPNGEEETFYSGGEFRRKTGFDNTNLSNASKRLPYTFKKGKMKGYTLLKVFKSYKSNKGAIK